MIKMKDFDRLLAELLSSLDDTADDPIAVWAAENDLPDETLGQMTDQIVQLTISETALKAAEEGTTNITGEFMRNFSSSILMAFIMGWEASKQYGKPSTTP